MPTHDEIDACKYFYLKHLSEPCGHALRLVIEEALTGSQEQSITGTISGLPIVTSALSRVFELKWDSYVAYAVTNESYAAVPDGEVYEGKLLRYYTKSRYLDYVHVSTWITDEYLGPLRHWQIICLDHVVDVVAIDDPQISKMNRLPNIPSQ